VATYRNGILGSFSGTIGSVVGSSWRGIPVIRSKPTRKKTGVTDLQEQQRARFLLMTGFLRPLIDLLNQTYQKSAVGMTCFNKAFSENKAAITGDYPAIKIDYSKIVLSKGRLPLGEPPMISSHESGRLLLTWKTGDGINRHLTMGRAFIATYSEELNRWIFKLFNLDDGHTSCILEVDPFRGKQVQTYIGFISGSNNRTTQSRYMGSIEIQP